MKPTTASTDLAGIAMDGDALAGTVWRNPAPNAAAPSVPNGAFRSFTLSHAPEAKPEPDATPAWVATPADRAWHFCERAARGDHLTYVEVERAFLPFVGLDKIRNRSSAEGDHSPCAALDDKGRKAWLEREEVGLEQSMQNLRNACPDLRKPWTEPTVTECATTNRRPATLTIAGVDLPNPEGVKCHATPSPDHIRSAISWLRALVVLLPTRAGEFESVARTVEGMSAEIQRQAAEITELQGMLEEAIGPVRLVSELATMTDPRAEFQRAMAQSLNHIRSLNMA